MYGVVDDWREEIHSLDDHLLVADSIDRGIVRRAKTHQQIWKIRSFILIGEWTQDLRQFGCADFRRSTRARGVRREANLFSSCHENYVTTHDWPGHFKYFEIAISGDNAR